MKKSVRIRKAGEGETPGYYNKTAGFLNKVLPKAESGMQVQERLKVIMLDTYASLRDGADPNAVFESLVTKYGIKQEMAYQIMHTVMTKLAEQKYKDPAYLEDEEEEDGQGAAPQPTDTPTFEPPQPTEANNTDDEDIALAESDMPSGYDGMQHLTSGTEEYAQDEAFQYGGYYDDGGEYEDYMNYFADNNSSEEDTILDQYANPGQLSTTEQVPFDLSRLIKFTPGAQNVPQTPYYQTEYRPVSDTDDMSQEFLPTGKYGGLAKFAKGRAVGSAPKIEPAAGPGKGRRGRKSKVVTPKPAEPVTPTVNPIPQRVVTPQESVVTPSTWQKYQNFYANKNPLSDRGFVGRRVENLGTAINTIRPQNWREKWRADVAPSTTTTKIIQDIYNLTTNKEYTPSVLQKNEDGSFNTGLGFNMDPGLSKFLLENATELNDLLSKSKKKTTDIDLIKLSALTNTGMPESIAPELDFLSIHRQNNGKLKFTKDESGMFKVEILSEVPTRLKGHSQSSIKLKDELLIDPKTNEIIDPKTKLPLETVDKNYFMGNQLSWYNSPYRFPFTSKYPGLDLNTYPQIISENPLQKDPLSGWRTGWNIIGKPMAFSPMILPFSYPRFAERSRFYPNASNVKTQYLGRQREVGPQAPGGMTFGDQPFGAQYADYNLLKNRNYETGKGFLKTAGILAGLGYLGYDAFVDEADKDFMYDRGLNQLLPSENINFRSRGNAFDPNAYGVDTSRFIKDSIFINNGDTVDDKGWGKPAPDYKKGGAQKKQFVKNVMSKYAPGGESQDYSLGKGNRYDTLTNDVTKKKSNFVGTLKTQSDKAASEDLYAAVQKSGDPNLMNIFMGQGQEQPQDNQMMQQPQFGEEGGYVNMDVENPLTRFIYGGNDYADFSEPYSLPEAARGIATVPGGSGGQYIADEMSPALDENLNPNEDDIVENPITNCPPGFLWSKTYNQCIPIMRTTYNPRIVRGRTNLASTMIPWNPIFRSYLTDAPRRRDNPYTLRNLRKRKNEDRYRILPMLMARDAERGDSRGFNSYGMQNFLSRILPFGAFLQPKYANGGVTTPSWMSGTFATPDTDAPEGTTAGFDEFGNPISKAPNAFPPPATAQQFYVNAEEPAPPANNNTNYNDPTQYRKVTTMDGEVADNVFNMGLNTFSGITNRSKNNPRSLNTTYQATDILNQAPISNIPYFGQQQDIGQNMGTMGPEQGNDRNSWSTFGSYAGAKDGGYMAYGGFADPYSEEEEVYMTPEELEQFLAAGGQVEYL